MNPKVDEYFDAAESSRRQRLDALHNAIIECFPDVQIDLKYNMPSYSYGKGWVAIANQKNYVSLYTCGESHLAEFKKRHPDFKTGKGCINFRAKDTLPIDDIKRVIRHAILHPKG